MRQTWKRDDILPLLRARPGTERQALYDRADAVRRTHMGDEVHLRGIIEFSNHCRNDCHYCGLRAGNSRVARYRLTDEEILDVAGRMIGYGQTTVVLQSGEAPSREGDAALGRLIARIKAATPLAVTVSVGNRPREVYASWRDCGLDRYLLRFETSDPALFARFHPDCDLAERLRCLDDLRALGVQVGSGFMVGLPGETPEVLADNILLCRDLGLDMIGIGPFLPHPDTPLGKTQNVYARDPDMHFLALAPIGNLAYILHIRTHWLRDTGACMSPFAAFLFLLGIETLHLRMPRHCANALAVARFLEAHPAVAWVNYPGLASHPDHALAERYLPQGAGAIIGFGIEGGRQAGVRLIDHVKLASHLANIGDAKTLIIHPASTTHQQLTEAEQAATGVTPEYVRLSVGIEDVADIIADLDQALRTAVRG